MRLQSNARMNHSLIKCTNIFYLILTQLMFVLDFFNAVRMLEISVIRPVGTSGARGHVPTQYLEPLVVK